ncbi:unnamed protein product [Lota lota]
MVRDQERDYRRLKIRLRASDRLRKDLAEKAFEALQKERKHILYETSTLAEGNAETLKWRTNSLHRSGLNTNKYGSAASSSSHCSSRWSTNPYMSPSLAHDDNGLQRIVAEVNTLTYGISQVLREAHDGRSPSYSQSSVSAADRFSFLNGLL